MNTLSIAGYTPAGQNWLLRRRTPPLPDHCVSDGGTRLRRFFATRIPTPPPPRARSNPAPDVSQTIRRAPNSRVFIAAASGDGAVAWLAVGRRTLSYTSI